MPNRRIRLIPYKQGSRSCRALADAIGAKTIKLDGTSKFRNTERDFCINWGNNNPPDTIDNRFVLNHPEAIRTASNKLAFFQRCSEKGLDNFIPPYYNNKEDIPDEAFPIVCRTLLNAHSGRGIVIANSRDELVDAPLFTKYLKKKDEYRIHFAYPIRGDQQESIMLAVQHKRRRLDHDNPNWQVRNHDNGFIYARENVNEPQCVVDAARTVFEQATDLDFGAVDVIYNDHDQRAYVLEVNTAPGLEGQTLQDYANHYGNV
jgi:hypothetical protein